MNRKDKFENFMYAVRSGQFERGYASACFNMAISCIIAGVVGHIVSRKGLNKADKIWNNNLAGHIYVDKKE